MAAPNFGLFAFGPQASGVGDTVSFDYFSSTGRTRAAAWTAPAPVTNSTGARWTRRSWNAIVARRPDEVRVVERRAEGHHGRRRHLHQPATRRGPATSSCSPRTTPATGLRPGDQGRRHQLDGGYAQGGILVYADDDNYVKFDAISDDGQRGSTDRAALRGQAGAIQNPQPQVTAGFPAARHRVWLRLTKTGTTYMGEYSLDGPTWTALAGRSPTRMTNAAFGLFTLGVHIADPSSASSTSRSTAPPAARRPSPRTTRR